MALGNDRSFNNGGNASNGGKKLFENTYYARPRFKDLDNKLTMGFNFKSGMLVLDISAEKDGFSYDTVASVFITSNKSKILLKEIAKFDEEYAKGNLDPNKGFGITTGMGDVVTVLVLHANPNGGRSIFVGKVNKDGVYTSGQEFNFPKEYSYGLEWNNVSNMDVNKVYYDDVEYEQFCDTIREFSTASTGAYAYFVADITRYDTRTILNKMNPIYEKLGIEIKSYNNKPSGSSFFNNMGNSGDKSSDHKSIDDIVEDDDLEE